MKKLEVKNLVGLSLLIIHKKLFKEISIFRTKVVGPNVVIGTLRLSKECHKDELFSGTWK